MPFLVLSYDHELTGRAVRARTRAAHLRYVAENKGVMVHGGALLSDEGAMIGTLAIVDVPDRAALDRFLESDPYNKAELFSRVIIHPVKQMLPETEPGAFAREVTLAAARSAGPPPGEGRS